MDKKKLYETIMQNVSKQVKKSLNEDEEFETNPTITEEDGEVYLDLTLYVDKYGFNVWIQDHEGGSGLEALGKTPEEAADNAASYICDYFYKRDEDDEDDEDYEYDADEEQR